MLTPLRVFCSHPKSATHCQTIISWFHWQNQFHFSRRAGYGYTNTSKLKAHWNRAAWQHPVRTLKTSGLPRVNGGQLKHEKMRHATCLTAARLLDNTDFGITRTSRTYQYQAISQPSLFEPEVCARLLLDIQPCAMSWRPTIKTIAQQFRATPGSAPVRSLRECVFFSQVWQYSFSICK